MASKLAAIADAVKAVQQEAATKQVAPAPRPARPARTVKPPTVVAEPAPRVEVAWPRHWHQLKWSEPIHYRRLTWPEEEPEETAPVDSHF